MRLIDADALNKHWFYKAYVCTKKECSDCIFYGMDSCAYSQEHTCGEECAVCSYNKDGERCGLIDLEPTVDPVRHGRWKKLFNNSEYGFECSLCGDIVWYSSSYNYCSNCGAKMDKEN